MLSAFDSLPLAADAKFRQVVEAGRLRYAGGDGMPDLVDRLSARLACSALRTRRPEALLVVLPDQQPRRCPVLFATALVTDAIECLDATAVGHRVLYVSRDAGVRSQLRSMQAGTLALGSVFDQQYGRGSGERLQTMSAGGHRLPAVLCIQAPADPTALIRQHRPSWIAVDCGDGKDLAWLPSLLASAKQSNTPVIGWTDAPFSGPVQQWIAAGGGVFRWPRRRAAASPYVDRLDQLWIDALTVDVTPLLLTGESAMEISRSFASAAEALLAASAIRDGRLAADAVAVGWMYLRTMESLPVPIDVYEREAGAYWGVRRISELHDALARFAEAIVSSRLRSAIGQALESLAYAHARLEVESPLWLGLVNLCMDGDCAREIVFPSRARLQMFRHGLLAEFNVSDADLRDVGVQLRSLGYRDAGRDPVEHAGVAVPPAPSASLLVGMPARQSNRHLEAYLQATHPEILLWPHHEHVLHRRLQALSSDLTFACRGLRALLPALDGIDQDGAVGRQQLRVGVARGVTTKRLNDETHGAARAKGFWKRPDAAQAIASLFGTELPAEDEEDSPNATVLDDVLGDSADTAEGTDAWVQDAVEIRVEGGQSLLLPSDEKVNVIARGATGVTVTPRFVRSLRAGEEILFIQGQRRQSLYELLVSRVHRNPVIAQYLELVRRWQDDFGSSYAEAERSGKTSAERFLAELQSKGSSICTTATVRAWARREVLAPSDVMDIKRVAEIFSLDFVQRYFRQIHSARNRLWGLHINLSARLNRWIESSESGSAALAHADGVIDAELGLTVEDFRHSLLRLHVVAVAPKRGPFYRPTLGHLDGGRS